EVRMSVLAVIPARLASSRLPEKPLKLIGGKTLVERAWACAKSAATVDRVVIATDAAEILQEAKRFGAEAVMTPVECQCGSERVYAAMKLLGQFEIVLNVQGDMPFLRGEVIDRLVQFLSERKELGMATVATPIRDEASFSSASVVKVVISAA